MVQVAKVVHGDVLQLVDVRLQGAVFRLHSVAFDDVVEADGRLSIDRPRQGRQAKVELSDEGENVNVTIDSTGNRSERSHERSSLRTAWTWREGPRSMHRLNGPCT